MLKAKYQDVMVGKNYLSLIYAFMRLKKAKTTTSLVVDEPNVKMGHGWCNNIGNIEKAIIENIGKTYKIDCLANLENYTRPINTIIFLNEKMIEFGPSPYANIREMARKLPDIFDKQYLAEFNKIDPEVFDEICFEFFDRMATLSVSNNKLSDFFQTDEKNLNKILNEFIDYIEGQQLVKKQLHFVLQVLHQTFFTNSINNIEAKYLLISILSPRYIIEEQDLLDDLIFAYQSLGGDITTANVSDWQVYNGESQFITLDSVDGVINFDHLFYFGRVTHLTPFTRPGNDVQFNSIVMECPLEHDFMNFFKNKRILISENDRLGTDFPHWEIEITGKGVLKSTYSFANYEGTKPSFYFKKVSEDVFRSLAQLLPGINLDDWSAQIDYKSGADFWVESLAHKSGKTSDYIYQDDGLYVDNKKVKNLFYCGPNRTRTLGLYSYTLDLIDSI
jgi:hypothetical protein